jgi:hypothetical protein
LAEKATRARVALVGGDTLLAKEVRELLEQSKPAPYVELISAAAENATMLGADDEEVLALSPLTAQSLTGSKVAFLAGSEASSRRALKLNPPDGPILIDLTGALQPPLRVQCCSLVCRESPRCENPSFTYSSLRANAGKRVWTNCASKR